MSIIKDSENQRLTALRRIQKDLEIAKADAEKRVRDTQTKRGAMIAEVESVVMSDLAKVQAEVAVQTARIKQVKQQLQADVIAPAARNVNKRSQKPGGKQPKLSNRGKRKRKEPKNWQPLGKEREITLKTSFYTKNWSYC